MAPVLITMIPFLLWAPQKNNSITSNQEADSNYKPILDQHSKNEPESIG